MSRHRWTAEDDAAVRAAAAEKHLEDHLRTRLAQALDVDPDDLTIELIRIPPARPCRHVRCRIRRWWKRVTS